MHDSRIIAAAGRCHRFAICLCMVLLLLNGCAAVGPKRRVPPPPPPTATVPPVVSLPPVEYKAVTGPAAGIYAEAEEALRAGRYSQAEMLLERALRIEPQNPHYWYTLGMTKYRQGQYPQAVQLCLKAESLAASQPGLLARNRELLIQAKEASGEQ